MQACSKALGLSPKRAMSAAEKLYSQGLVSYPRTETTRYSHGSLLSSVLAEHCSHPDWGRVASALQRRRRRGGNHIDGGVLSGGHDAGDHPPITPTRVATRAEVSKVGGAEWKVYEYVCRHFLGSLGGPMFFTTCRSEVRFDGADGRFVHTDTWLDDAGFAGAMPWTMRRAPATRSTPCVPSPSPVLPCYLIAM